MEYIYAAMLIHKLGGTVNEPTVKKVLEAAGAKVDEGKVKALVASLTGVDIEKVVKEAVVAPVAAAPSAGSEKKEDKKKDEAEEKASEEKAAAGLGALFG